MESKSTKFKRIGENLYIRNGIYYAIIRTNGKQTWRALEAIDKNTARAERDSLKKKLLGGFIITDKSLLPIFAEAVDELVETCKKRGMGERCLESVSDHLRKAKQSFFGSMKINAIRQCHLRAYLDKRYETRSGRTVNLDLIHLRKVFRFAIEEKKWRWDNPMEGITNYKHTEKEVPVPSQEEIDSVIHALRTMPIRGGKDCAVFVEFLRLTGMRFHEAQTALRSKVNFEKNYMEIKGKGDKWRIIDLFPNLRIFLQQLLSKPSTHDRIFPPSKGDVYDPRIAFALGRKASGVPHFSFHGIRHAWATRLVELGIDYATIAKWMGHSDGGMLVANRYGKHSRRNHFQDVAQKVTIGSSPNPFQPEATALMVVAA